MELWFDNHFSPIVAKWLKGAFGWNVKSSWSLSLTGTNDLDIFLKAKSAGDDVIIVTKDTDFSDIMTRLGPPPKVINVKMGNSDNQEMYAFLAAQLPKATKLLRSFETRIIDIE